jgi:hypothetical protein
MAAKKRASKKSQKFNSKKFILNCSPSVKQEDDWTFADAIEAGVVDLVKSPPDAKDLRAKWWKIDNQGRTGACVGYATAYGVLRYHYVVKGLIKK